MIMIRFYPFLDDGRLLAGSYEYNFECELPHDLPTSFESEFGRIQYKACVIMNFPEWPEKKFKIPFTVLRALDLREDLSLQETLHVNELKTFHTIPSIFCTLSDPLEMNCMLLIRGYTPGETIRLILATKNGSTQPVHGFIVQLIKVSFFFSLKRKIHFQQFKSYFALLLKTRKSSIALMLPSKWKNGFWLKQ